jgi:predicted acylesterase/phospholipase RssA
MSRDEGCNLSTCTDVYASTSASTIFTSALMLKDMYGRVLYSPRDILKLYIAQGKNLFSRKSDDSFPLNALLNTFFTEYTLADLNKHFLFVSYNQVTEKPFFFSDSMLHYRDLPLSQAMQACSAYPTVFPPLKLGKMELVDGSLVTKNPASLAYNHTRLLYPNDPIILVSLGIGEVPEKHQDFFEKDALAVDLELQMLKKTDRKLVYFRMQPKINYAPKEVFEDIDSSIRDLLVITDQYISENQESLSEIHSLIKSRFL